jgi:hypothetical protein
MHRVGDGALNFGAEISHFAEMVGFGGSLVTNRYLCSDVPSPSNQR